MLCDEEIITVTIYFIIPINNGRNWGKLIEKQVDAGEIIKILHMYSVERMIYVSATSYFFPIFLNWSYEKSRMQFLNGNLWKRKLIVYLFIKMYIWVHSLVVVNQNSEVHFFLLISQCICIDWFSISLKIW